MTLCESILATPACNDVQLLAKSRRLNCKRSEASPSFGTLRLRYKKRIRIFYGSSYRGGYTEDQGLCAIEPLTVIKVEVYAPEGFTQVALHDGERMDLWWRRGDDRRRSHHREI